MTNHPNPNNAAQAAILRRLNQIHADAGYLFGRAAADGACAGAMAESVRIKIDEVKTLLSKLRAPVAEDDEVKRIRGLGPAYPYTTNTAPPTPLARVPVADERAAFNKCHSTIIKALAAIAMADGPDTRREDDPELIYRSPVMDDVVRIRIALDECSAALASAPVAGEATDTFRNLLLEAVHRYGNARAMAEHDIKQRGQISKTVAAILDLLDAAPQASAEAAQAPTDVAQLVAFIFDRFGQPGDAGALPDNVAAAVRRLERGIKAQADKDGGQQRAGDAALARLAEPHTGMRVDYQGLLRQAREGLHDSPGLAEMLRQLQGHLRELGQRWYAGDTAVVDELLQLYCVESNARAALSATQTEQGERDE